jgi:ABC-type multidrug transport system fused ATPase/permease subunit
MNTFNFLYTYAKRQWPTLLITMIVVLENSRIVQSGTHEELIEAEGRYRMLSTAAG